MSGGNQESTAEFTDKQAQFCQEYVLDFNATQAAVRAGYSPKTAYTIGHSNLKKQTIRDEINRLLAERRLDNKFMVQVVLDRWFQIANADPNELVQYRRVNCRHCWGQDHYYQWTTVVEYQKAVADAKVQKKAKPDCDGGYGFDKTREPHADCPECRGEGRGELHIRDTTKLVGDARLLYAGAKVTKEGLVIEMHSKEKALENIARFLGMFVDRKEITGKDGAPIQTETAVVPMDKYLAARKEILDEF